MSEQTTKTVTLVEDEKNPRSMTPHRLGTTFRRGQPVQVSDRRVLLWLKNQPPGMFHVVDAALKPLRDHKSDPVDTRLPERPLPSESLEDVGEDVEPVEVWQDLCAKTKNGKPLVKDILVFASENGLAIDDGMKKDKMIALVEHWLNTGEKPLLDDPDEDDDAAEGDDD
jgi:hypothetical protein